MAKLIDDGASNGNVGRELAIGEQRTWHARDKTTREITKTFTLTRTARDYIYDLCDAYNAARSSSAAGEWYVVGEELRFGDPLWRNEEQWRECVRRNDEWLWERRHAAQGIEARSDETCSGSAEGESPVFAQQECA